MFKPIKPDIGRNCTSANLYKNKRSIKQPDTSMLSNRSAANYEGKMANQSLKKLSSAHRFSLIQRNSKKHDNH